MPYFLWGVFKHHRGRTGHVRKRDAVCIYIYPSSPPTLLGLPIRTVSVGWGPRLPGLPHFPELANLDVCVESNRRLVGG